MIHLNLRSWFVPALSSSLILAGFARSHAATAPSEPDLKPTIERITFIGNRTDADVLRRHLPFKEGDALDPGTLGAARKALYRMRLFKQVEISSSATDAGKAEISIRLHDGWYMVPFPFFATGSGGARGGVFLAAKNILRRTESMSVMGMSGPSGKHGAFGAELEGWSVDVSFDKQDYSERQYTDSAFSAVTGLRGPSDQDHPEKYGTVSNSYNKHTEEVDLAFGIPLLRDQDYIPRLKASLSWEKSMLRYSDPSLSLPEDRGRQGQIVAGLQYGRTERSGGDALGAIFGFGLANLDQRIQPLAKPRFDASVRLSYHQAARWTGSDFNYSYGLARWDSAVTWGHHRSLALRLAGGHGEDLPANRLLNTGDETAMQGSYAREYRGVSAAGAGLIYSHPFRTTRRGIWQGVAFLEDSRAWFHGRPKDKPGIGVSFWYRFWRFPLPLGASYTYSMDDRSSQVSGAIGGRF